MEADREGGVSIADVPVALLAGGLATRLRPVTATRAGWATRNMPGRPCVIFVSTKPGFTVVTGTPTFARRTRSPSK